MKKILFLSVLFASFWSYADDLEVAVTDADPGVANGAVNLSVSGGIGPFTYSWTGPDGFVSTDEDLVGVESGIYTVTVTDAYCGVATLEVEVGINNFSSISKNEESAISVYPNPTKDMIYVQSEEPVKTAVYTSSGQIILQAAFRKSIDLSDQAPGLYFIHVYTAEGVLVRKVTLQ
ncbi:MAG: T9SS type A sorting domain-containing protein [Crocinitomicaceae bacterium]